MERRPGLIRIFFAFLRLGLTAFGGPAMVRYIRDLSCKRNKWVDEKEFDHGIALVQTIPGATAMQAAAYAGLKTAGGPGAMASFTGFAIPAFFLMLALSYAYKYALDIRPIAACFSGLKVVVVAIVANATISFGKKIIKTSQDIFLFVLSTILFYEKQNPVLIIGICAFMGLFLYNKIIKDPASHDTSSFKNVLFSASTKKLLQFTALLSAVVLFILLFLFSFFPDLFRLCLIMMKVDFFAYGGGYASLPLMLHEIVDKRHLLSQKVFMDGIALGQITPGPIVITAAFVGFMLKGIVGAVFCSWAIFTPSLLILLSTTPFYDSFKDVLPFKRAMRGVLASFVGLLLAVFLSFFFGIYWDIPHAVIGISSFLALYYGIDILWVVLVAGGISSLILL